MQVQSKGRTSGQGITCREWQSLFKCRNAAPTFGALVPILGTVFKCTALAYILYFRLIANVGAAKAITVAYLVPVFGVLWGILFLNEHLTPIMWAKATLVLLGVAMTDGFLNKQVRIDKLT